MLLVGHLGRAEALNISHVLPDNPRPEALLRKSSRAYSLLYKFLVCYVATRPLIDRWRLVDKSGVNSTRRRDRRGPALELVARLRNQGKGADACNLYL